MMMIIIIVVLLICMISLSLGFNSNSNRCSSVNRCNSNIRSSLTLYGKKVTPTEGESMDEYRQAVLGVLASQTTSPSKLGGREFLEMVIKKWGVAYDIQLRKNTPFGEGSGNIYLNVMWRYFGQKSFPLDEREYLEHLEALGRYITAIDRVQHVKDKVKESRKRPNAYFGYAVSIPLDVDPSSADAFFKDLKYE